MFGFGDKKSLFGLDLGSSSIKVAELAQKRSGYILKSFGAVGLPADTIVDGEVLNHTAVVDSIKHLTSELSISATDVCTSIAGLSLILKHITIPMVPAREMEDQVYWEAEQYVPFDLSEISMDYEVLIPETVEGKTEVLLVAVRNDFVEKRLAAIRDAGYNPSVVDVDVLALANVYWANYDCAPNTSTLLVDIGASLVKINIVTNNTTLFTRDVTVGGKDLTEDIQDKLGVSFQEAETLKIDAAASDQIPEEVVAAINGITENIVLELRRSLDFFIASNSEFPIAKAYISGGSCRIPGLLNVMEEMIGLSVEFLNPFERIEYNKKVYNDDFIAAIASSAVVPLGLAMRNFN